MRQVPLHKNRVRLHPVLPQVHLRKTRTSTNRVRDRRQVPLRFQDRTDKYHDDKYPFGEVNIYERERLREQVPLPTPGAIGTLKYLYGTCTTTVADEPSTTTVDPCTTTR